jgi:branched-subunit amino acid ABC-type transport system permease component
LLVEGIKFGSIIAITAVGLSLIFGTTGLINFAHGELSHAGRHRRFRAECVRDRTSRSSSRRRW